MNFVYIVRRDRGWKDFRPSRVFDSHPVYPVMRQWNRCFNISYIEFRKFLNNIREDNLKQIKGLSECYDTYQQAAVNAARTKGNIILPTDDDDWFRHDVVDILSQVDWNMHPSARWKHGQLRDGRLDVWWCKGKHDCWYHSNNYALRGPVNHYQLVTHHLTCNTAFSFKGLEQYLPYLLSIHNKSLASLSISQNNSMDDLVRSYELCREGPDSATIPIYFLEYVDRLTDFYRNKLKLRKMF